MFGIIGTWFEKSLCLRFNNILYLDSTIFWILTIIAIIIHEIRESHTNKWKDIDNISKIILVQSMIIITGLRIYLLGKMEEFDTKIRNTSDKIDDHWLLKAIIRIATLGFELISCLLGLYVLWTMSVESADFPNYRIAEYVLMVISCGVAFSVGLRYNRHTKIFRILYAISTIAWIIIAAEYLFNEALECRNTKVTKLNDKDEKMSEWITGAALIFIAKLKVYGCIKLFSNHKNYVIVDL